MRHAALKQMHPKRVNNDADHAVIRADRVVDDPGRALSAPSQLASHGVPLRSMHAALGMVRPAVLKGLAHGSQVQPTR